MIKNSLRFILSALFFPYLALAQTLSIPPTPSTQTFNGFPFSNIAPNSFGQTLNNDRAALKKARQAVEADLQQLQANEAAGHNDLLQASLDKIEEDRKTLLEAEQQYNQDLATAQSAAQALFDNDLMLIHFTESALNKDYIQWQADQKAGHTNAVIAGQKKVSEDQLNVERAKQQYQIDQASFFGTIDLDVQNTNTLPPTQ